MQVSAKERREEKRRNKEKTDAELQAAAEEAEKKRMENERNERRMHLESLVNFMAFNRYKRHRNFLCSEDRPPPQPHRKPSDKPAAAPQAMCVTLAAADRANSEAQAVLKGAMTAKRQRAEAAKGLLHQLQDLDVSDEFRHLLAFANS